MPSVYLSPSVQEFNPYVIGGNEEYYMNLIVDAMVPYLQATGITFNRNNPGEPLAQAINNSNSGNYDFHLALHSNSSPESMAGLLQGPDIYYYESSVDSERAAQIFAENLRILYPNADLITVIPNTTLAELRRTVAPAILIEVAYHDNYEDAWWIVDNIQELARNFSDSLARYFGIPFVDPYT